MSKDQRIEQIQDKFQALSANNRDYNTFYAWRSEVEQILKVDLPTVLKQQEFYAQFFVVLASQIQSIPAHFQAETVSMKMRLKWLIRDVKEKGSSQLLESIREVEKLDSNSMSEVYELESPVVVKSPTVRLSSSMRMKPLTGDQSSDFYNRNLTFETRYKACNSSSDFDELANALILEFYEFIHERQPVKLLNFLNDSSKIYPRVVRNSSHLELLVALLDTLPYLLFKAHKSPYDETYIDCARKVGNSITRILEDKKIDFKKQKNLYLDDVLHYLIHALFFFLEQGRLVAFEDLLDTALKVLEVQDRIPIRFDYIALLPEIFYWIPRAYRSRLKQAFQQKVEDIAQKNPDSPLSSLIYLVTTDPLHNLDERILVTEFLKEVYKDREVAEQERLVIKRLMGELKYDLSAYRKLLREVFREIGQDHDVQNGDLDRVGLMKKLIRLSIVDSKIFPKQRDLLLKASRALEFSVARYHEMEMSVLNKRNELEKAGPGLQRLDFSNVPEELLKSLEFYKYKQLKSEEFQRILQPGLSLKKYNPKQNAILLDGEVKESFKNLEGELKITGFESGDHLLHEEVNILFYSPRKYLRQWFEIVNQIEYILFDSTDKTLSIEIYLLNKKGKILITRDAPMNNPDRLRAMLKRKEGLCNLFILESSSTQIVHWLPHSCYLVEIAKIRPLLDALKSRNFTSVKVLSKIGQRKNPDEIVYYHVMLENSIYLSSSQEESQKMISMAQDLIKNKFPGDFKLYFYLGYLYFEIGDNRHGFEYTLECLKRKPDYKEALYLYCEKKLAEDILDPLALGYLKYLDLNFHEEERLANLYLAIEKKHSLQLQPLLSRSRFTITSRLLHDKGQN